MLKKNKGITRILILLLAATLVLTGLSAGALAESFSAAVKVKSMKVYADASGQSYLGSLSKKTIVTVEEYEGGVARIRYNGMTGYAKVSDMRTVESFAKKAKTNTNTRVYQQPDASSASVSVKSGVSMNVLGISGGIAMVEKDGKVGYVKAAHLNIEGQANGGVTIPEEILNRLPADVVDEIESGNMSQSQLEDLKRRLEEMEAAREDAEREEASSPETIEQAFASGKYSNEQLCFAFAVKVMGYNKAAAAGLLANINAESGFRPAINGDSGTSYGICQWHASRKIRLLSWCESKDMDASTLSAQLYFLKHELETYYPSVNRYMKNVENSAQGAYDAAYYFCYNFEAPANRVNQSVSRGNSARNTYYPRYENASI